MYEILLLRMFNRSFINITRKHCLTLLLCLVMQRAWFYLPRLWEILLPIRHMEGRWNFMCSAHRIETWRLKNSTGTSLSCDTVPVILEAPQNKSWTVSTGTISLVESSSTKSCSQWGVSIMLSVGEDMVLLGFLKVTYSAEVISNLYTFFVWRWRWTF